MNIIAIKKALGKRRMAKVECIEVADTNDFVEVQVKAGLANGYSDERWILIGDESQADSIAYIKQRLDEYERVKPNEYPYHDDLDKSVLLSFMGWD